MTVKVAINGFGRIGRNILRGIVESGVQHRALRNGYCSMVASDPQIAFIDAWKRRRGAKRSGRPPRPTAVVVGITDIDCGNDIDDEG